LINFLDESKIGTRLLFAGNLTKQPYMSDLHYRVSGDLSNTEIVMNQTLWLGVYPGLGHEELEFISERIEEFLGISF
jgi:CDP-6-deoxy-D-xylo-4-hexulose-3-dehydrase